MTAATLREMSGTDVKRADISGLVHIESVRIDEEQDVFVRMREYLRQIKNPYCFLVGSTPVGLSFHASGKPVDEALLRYFLSLRQQA